MIHIVVQDHAISNPFPYAKYCDKSYSRNSLLPHKYILLLLPPGLESVPRFVAREDLRLIVDQLCTTAVVIKPNTHTCTHLMESHVLSQLLHRKNVQQLVHCRVLGVSLQLRHSGHSQQVVLLPRYLVATREPRRKRGIKTSQRVLTNCTQPFGT